MMSLMCVYSFHVLNVLNINKHYHRELHQQAKHTQRDLNNKTNMVYCFRIEQFFFMSNMSCLKDPFSALDDSCHSMDMLKLGAQCCNLDFFEPCHNFWPVYRIFCILPASVPYKARSIMHYTVIDRQSTTYSFRSLYVGTPHMAEFEGFGVSHTYCAYFTCTFLEMSI